MTAPEAPISDTSPGVVNTVLAIVVATLVGFALVVCWLAAAGELPSQEPSPTTWYSGPGDDVEVHP